MTSNTRIGYARVSTEDQNLDLQRDALTNAGCAQVYQEKASGKGMGADRPEWAQCVKALRSARYIGLAKTHLQHVLTATALNLVRVGEWLFGSPRAKTRVSRFTQLAPAV